MKDKHCKNCEHVCLGAHHFNWNEDDIWCDNEQSKFYSDKRLSRKGKEARECDLYLIDEE